MNNQPSTAMIAGIMSGIAAACFCLIIALALQNRSLQSQLSEARQVCSESAAHSADLRVQHASTSADLSSHRERLAELQQQVAALESKVTSNVTVSSRPIPVRIFDGNRLAGVGWIPASATNRAGLAGDGVATVFLDRRNSIAPAAEGPPAAQTTPAVPAAAAASSAFVIQQYPYCGWVWPYGSWGGALVPTDDSESITPQPPSPPFPPPAPDFLPASPTPAHTVVTRTLPSRQPVFAPPRVQSSPFPPRIPTVQPRVSAPAVATTRMLTPSVGNRAGVALARQPVTTPYVRR